MTLKPNYIDNLPIAILILDKNSTIKMVNKKAQDLLNYKSLKGKPAEFIFYKKEIASSVLKKLKNDNLTDFEIRIKQKNNKFFWAIISSSIVNTDSKEYCLTISDITQIKLTEEALMLSNEKYSTLVEKGNDGIVIIQDGKVKFANTHIIKLTGYNPNEFKDANFTEFVPDEYKKLIKKMYELRMEGSVKQDKYEIEIISKAGKRIPVEINGSRIEYNKEPADMAIIRDITDTKNAIEALKNSSFETLEALSTIMEDNDPYTAGHSSKVAELSLEIADKLTLGEKEKDVLKIAALLHDLGKVGIPGSILNKPTRLSHAERIMLNAHPIIGAKAVENITAFRKVSKIILHHHEAWDGSGYPNGLKKESIPLLSRIIAVADSFDAMTSERPYRMVPLKPKSALDVLKSGAGKIWDKEIVKIFLALKSGK